MSSVQQKLVGNEVDKDKDDLPSIDEAELLECEGSENLYLIEKMLGESIPLKTIMDKTKSNWMPLGEIKYVLWVVVLHLLKLLMRRTATMYSLINLVYSRTDF